MSVSRRAAGSGHSGSPSTQRPANGLAWGPLRCVVAEVLRSQSRDWEHAVAPVAGNAGEDTGDA